jgi:undecaprenyl pyrophosphate phosphatase UppP
VIAMQHRRRYSLFRRVLFPYDGVEALTWKQIVRVLLGWILIVPLLLSCCTLILTLIFGLPPQQIEEDVLFTFLSIAFIFGCLGVLVVITNNLSARVRQGKKTDRVSNTSGVRYGSKR